MDLTSLARSIVDASLYMTIASADELGRPWASPVYFAHESYSEFFWVSSPQATHSRNIAARPAVGIVIFDSAQPIGTGQGVYIAADAEQVADPTGAMAVYSRRSLAHGGSEWGPERVREGAPLRLYRAVAAQLFMLDPERDQRMPLAL